MRENPRGSATRIHRPSGHLLRSLLVAAFLLFAVLVGIAGYLEKWLWMRQLDYTGIFWTLLSVQWAMFCVGFRLRFSVPVDQSPPGCQK